MLTTAQRSQLFGADEACRVAIAVAQTTAEDTGFLGSESTNLAAVQTARLAYEKARQKLTGYLERPDTVSDAEAKGLVQWYADIGDFGALRAGVAASSLGGAIVGTVKDTAATVVNPAAWPSWLKWSAGTVLLVVVAIAVLPMVFGAILRGMFGGKR